MLCHLPDRNPVLVYRHHRVQSSSAEHAHVSRLFLIPLQWLSPRLAVHRVVGSDGHGEEAVHHYHCCDARRSVPAGPRRTAAACDVVWSAPTLRAVLGQAAQFARGTLPFLTNPHAGCIDHVPLRRHECAWQRPHRSHRCSWKLQPRCSRGDLRARSDVPPHDAQCGCGRFDVARACANGDTKMYRRCGEQGGLSGSCKSGVGRSLRLPKPSSDAPHPLMVCDGGGHASPRGAEAASRAHW